MVIMESDNYIIEDIQDDTKKWFFFVNLYLFIDYIRPQDFLPIGIIKPGMIATIILIIYIFSKWDKEFLYENQIRMVLYFILLLSAYIPFASNNYFAFKTTREVFLFTPFIISVYFTVNSLNRLRKIIIYLICIMTYISFYSLFKSGQGSGSYFTDENDLSLYINMWLPFCYFLLLYETGFKNKLVYLVGLIFGLAAVVVSFSRGGFVGLIVMTCIAWLFSSKKLVSFTIMLIAGIVIYFFSSEAYKTEISTISNMQESTAQARFESWSAAWKMFLDHPLGIGGNNFQILFEEYQSKWFDRNMWGRVAHSLWFTLLPELGIFGVIIYLRLLYYNIKDIFFIKRESQFLDEENKYLFYLSMAFISSLAGFFASASFLSVLYYPHYFYITALIVAAKKIVSQTSIATDSELLTLN